MQSFRNAVFISLEHEYYSKSIHYIMIKHQKNTYVLYDKKNASSFRVALYNPEVQFYELDQTHIVKEFCNILENLHSLKGADKIVCWCEEDGWKAIQENMIQNNIADSLQEFVSEKFSIYDLWEIFLNHEQKLSKRLGLSTYSCGLYFVSNVLSRSNYHIYETKMNETERIFLEHIPQHYSVTDIVEEYLEIHILCMKNILNHLLLLDFIKWTSWKMEAV